VLGEGKAFLTNLGSSGGNLRKPCILTRQPDGRWFEKIWQAALAPDGSFSIICGRQGNYNLSPWTVSIFASDGTPKRVFSLPEKFDYMCYAWNGSYFATREGDRLAVFDAMTGAGVLAFVPELPRGLSLGRGGWEFFSVRGGRELWLIQIENRIVVRLAWPM
jgi:hypothetical protein